MATWSLVGSNTDTLTASDSGTFTLPGTPAEGDIVVLVFAKTTNVGSAISVDTSGYSTGTAGLGRDLYAWKVLGATPDTDVQFSTGSGGPGAAVLMQMWRGGRAIDVTATTASSFGSGVPNCPSNTSVTDNALFLALGSSATILGGISAPSGYTNLGTHAPAATCIISSKEVTTAGAEDPAVYTATGSATWGALTLVLRNADAADPPITVSQTNLVLSTTAPTVVNPSVNNTDRIPSSGSLTLSTSAATVFATDPKSVSPSSGNLALSETAPTVAWTDNQAITVSSANVIVTTSQPDVTQLTSGEFRPQSAQLSFSTSTPTVTATDYRDITPSVAQLVVSGSAPDVLASLSASPSAGSLALSSQQPTVLVAAGDVVNPTHDPIPPMVRQRSTAAVYEELRRAQEQRAAEELAQAAKKKQDEDAIALLLLVA